MKRLALAPLALVLLFGLSAQSREKWLGTIRSPDGGAFNNLNSPDAGFSLGYGLKLAVQCDAPACVAAVNGDAGVTCAPAQATTGVSVPCCNLYDLPLDSDTNAVAQVPVAVLTDGGVINCNVFLVTP